MITQDQLEMLRDMFNETEGLWKIDIELDPTSRTVVVKYWDPGDEDFRIFEELEVEAKARASGGAK